MPAGCAEAPTVAGLEAGKAEFRHRRGKIIAARFGKRKKRGGHDRAHRVAADILPPGIAAAVAKEARHRADRTEFEPVAEHVAGEIRPAASMRCRLSASSPPARLPAHSTIFERVCGEHGSGAAVSVASATLPRLFGNTARQICAPTHETNRQSSPNL